MLKKELYKDSLIRFLEPKTYELALQEIRKGKKQSHWIWWTFPQMRGLGYSGRSQYYGIKDREEAKAFINNPILRDRLVTLTKEVYNSEYTPYEIFGNDTIKFVSCMKLFASVSDIPIFKQTLSKYNWH